MNEPSELEAGMTIGWPESLTDYPSGTWSLFYTLQNRANGYRFQATNEADETFTVAVDRATSADWAPGEYTLTGYVESATERHVVHRSRVRVLANITTGDPLGLSAMTHAERVLEAVEAAIEGRATADQMSVAIGGRSLQRHTIAELLGLRAKYRNEVAVERGERPAVQNVALRFGRAS